MLQANVSRRVTEHPTTASKLNESLHNLNTTRSAHMHNSILSSIDATSQKHKDHDGQRGTVQGKS